MKSILCYGDSNTWGYVPGTGRRYPVDVRWTGLVQKSLGSGYRIIDEGLSGRYTVWDEPFRPGRNGAALLQPILESHRPLDWVVLMLGTNDVLHFKDNTFFDAARGASILIDIVRRTQAGLNDCSPPVLLVSPPLITELSEAQRLKCHGNPANSVDFGKYYRQVAEEKQCEFLDAGQVCGPSSIDGVHLDEEGHGRLAQAIAARLKTLCEDF